MNRLDFKNRLHFNEFPPTSTEEWEAVIEADLKGKNYKDVLRWNIGKGLAPLPFYRRQDFEKLLHDTSPVSHSARWNIIEPVEKNDAKSSNEQALHALENGASGLLFDLPQKAISSKADLEVLLQNIQIELIPIHFVSALSVPNIGEWVQDICTDRKLNSDSLSISFFLDPFTYAVSSGKLISLQSLKKTLQKFDDSFMFCAINTAFYGNSGATVLQQLAFSLSAANEYMGLDPKLASKLHFNFSVGPNYFIEIAKFRAFKFLWQQMATEYDIESVPPIHAETCLWNKSQTDAHNNMLRATTEAMSAALGGCDAITVHRYDQNFDEESGFSSRIARNIQLILQEEAYLDKVADPGAGSYYIEVLTEDIAHESWKLFQEIEQKGGFYECLKSGFIQKEIQNSKNQKINAFKEKKDVMIGVNKYPPEGKIQNPKFKIQNFEFPEPDSDSFLAVNKVLPLNIEAELQNGDVS